MSEENVETVRRIYEGWARGNMEAGIELFDPQIEFESFMPDAEERVTASGPQEIEQFMREFLSQWREYRLSADEFRAVGPDRVFAAGHQRARGRLSGVLSEDTIHSVWTFREGKVVHLLFDRDRNRTLEAAGLSE